VCIFLRKYEPVQYVCVCVVQEMFESLCRCAALHPCEDDSAGEGYGEAQILENGGGGQFENADEEL